jgi:hypothetical protein
MTRDDIMRLARETCAQGPQEDWDSTAWVFGDDGLERFAVVVAAAEREECAKICETLWDVSENGSATEEKAYGDECAAAIRDRGPWVKTYSGGKPNYT